MVSRHRGSGQGCVLSERVDRELQSEVHSWGSSSNDPPPRPPNASFMTEGEMFVTYGTWTLADGSDPALKENLQPSRACCAFIPQLSAHCFLLVS